VFWSAGLALAALTIARVPEALLLLRLQDLGLPVDDPAHQGSPRAERGLLSGRGSATGWAQLTVRRRSLFASVTCLLGYWRSAAAFLVSGLWGCWSLSARW
jgi:hypothetical protein